MLTNLKPISGSHSISRLVASVFIPQAFLKPVDVLEKVQTLSNFKNYQKRGVINSRTFNINDQTMDVAKDEAKGFVFEGFDDNGLVENIFKLENVKDKQSVLSLENRKYCGWTPFKEKFINDVTNLANEVDFYVDAVSLTYVDEFIWDDNIEDINTDGVFNSESELINKKFLSSKNGTLILISQGLNDDGISYEERTEISFNNSVKRIVLNHQYVLKIKEMKLFSQLNSEGVFLKSYESARKENKLILKDIFTKKCLELINLK
jgi:uncharacterized protein (TIGR04255 family)